jgi:hypothetical protein
MEEIMVTQHQIFNESFLKVKTILISSWDPLGVFAESSVQDEYDSYIPAISELLRKKETSETLSQYLQKIESDDFGLIPDKIKILAVANLLINNAINR